MTLTVPGFWQVSVLTLSPSEYVKKRSLTAMPFSLWSINPACEGLILLEKGKRKKIFQLQSISIQNSREL